MTIDPGLIERLTTDVKLHDGTRVRLRPVLPGDKARLLEGFEKLSPESRYRRFMSPVHELTPDMLTYLTEIDYVNHFAWAAFDLDAPGEPGIGVARYIRLVNEPDVAEAAVAVLDDYHGRGLGTALLQALGAVAVENGITRFRAYVLGENQPALELMRHLGGEVSIDGQGVMRVELDLPREVDEIKRTPLYRVLRAVASKEAPPVRVPRFSRKPRESEG